MRSLKEEFRHFRGQPIEVITDNGFKFCGIDADSNDDSVMLIDNEGRFVRIEFRHIDAVVEPQMKLKRLCGNNDCDCHRDCDCDCDDDDRRDRRRNRCDCNDD